MFFHAVENYFPQHGKLSSTPWKIAENDRFQRFEGVLGLKMIVFHAMENFSASFPQYGKLLAIFSTLWKNFEDFSTVWKTFLKFFHAMENFIRMGENGLKNPVFSGI